LEDWKFAQRDDAERLAKLHYFSMQKEQGSQEIEFVITIHEYVKPKDPSILFFAEADKETNQRTAPYRPHGWGRSLSEALSNCMEEIRRFPYEPAGMAAGEGRIQPASDTAKLK
jgi:hypothetical protein